jgi:UDP-2,3-diacylglucosamine hydrolase
MLRHSLQLEPGKKAYFASDFHLGAPDFARSLKREKKIVRWLEAIEPDCQYLFLLGDLFDFWFDYRHVAPQGFVRFLGKLAQMSDQGVRIFVFTGNHDMWMFGYLEKELGITIYRSSLDLDWGNFRMQVGHGDGLGPGDMSYKFLKRIFANPVCQWLFSFLHPTIGIGIAKAWSRHSRISSSKDEEFKGEKEFLWNYTRQQEAKLHRDVYIFGHRHLPLDLPAGEGSRYLNLGEWMNHCLYLEFDGTQVQIHEWKN